MVIYPDAIMHPWTMTFIMLGVFHIGWLWNSLIVLGNATIAPFAMFAPQWCANHTWNTEALFVELPFGQQLIDHNFLFL